MLVLLIASLGLNIYLFSEAYYFANRALAEQQLRKSEQAEYLQFVNDVDHLRNLKEERDALLLRHESKRPVP